MKKIPYNCKFCATPGETQIDEFDGYKVQLQKWIPYLACERCATFYEKKRGLVDSVASVCFKLIHIRHGNNPDQEKIEPALRTKLSNRIDSYAELICDYLKIETQTDPAFLETIFASPKSFNKILGIYFGNLRKAYPNTFQSNLKA